MVQYVKEREDEAGEGQRSSEEKKSKVRGVVLGGEWWPGGEDGL